MVPLLVLIIAAQTRGTGQDFAFPENFMLGVGSSAFQTEGAWDQDGKGASIWDVLTHERPELVADASSADVACDSYHLYREDVQLVKELGVGFYRFSISWPRVLPRGHVHIVNEEGVRYYNNLINELVNNGIEPVVTLYHWDLPQHLQRLGGWANPVMADYFQDYAHLLFTRFGDRVKWWITLQDPKYIAAAYSGTNMAPAVQSPGIGEYMATHTLLLAHANVYRLYHTKFSKSQQGKVGIALHGKWLEPLGGKEVNAAARDRLLQFVFGAFAHPILSLEGDYPSIVKERVARKSREEGFTRSRLPTLSKEEVQHIQGTCDFLGLNHYTSKLVEHNMHRGGDAEAETSDDPSWSSTVSPWLKVAPWGLRKLLGWIRQEYNNPPVLVTENGYPDLEGLHDKDRVDYLIDYMAEMLTAMKQDGCNVLGYTVWSLMDSFQWNEGYTEKYGLYAVNFSDPVRRRVPKDSVYVLSHIARSRELPRYLVHVTPEPGTPLDPQGDTSAAPGAGAPMLCLLLIPCLYLLSVPLYQCIL